VRFGGAQQVNLDVKKSESDPNSMNQMPVNYLYAQPQNFTGYIPQYTMMSYNSNGMMMNQD
jgi:hypothetical protein